MPVLFCDLWLFGRICFIYIYIYTGCPGRNVPDFGRMFLKLKYTDLTKNTYIRSWTFAEFVSFQLSGILLQTVKFLTCIRGTSSSWTTAFQPKDSKLHTECKSYDRLWCVQYCVYTSYCCCSNLYARITEHDNNQPQWMKDMSWMHQVWSVQ